MRLHEIITAVIRILAIKVGLDGVQFLFRTLARLRTHSFSVPDFIVLLLFAACAGSLWWLSPFLARRVTRNLDSTIEAPLLSLIDLYSFAFLSVGLYFTVLAFAPSLTWLHYAITQSTSDAALSPEQQSNFYSLFSELSQLVLGLALTFNGRRLATKLIKRQHEVA